MNMLYIEQLEKKIELCENLIPIVNDYVRTGVFSPYMIKRIKSGLKNIRIPENLVDYELDNLVRVLSEYFKDQKKYYYLTQKMNHNDWRTIRDVVWFKTCDKPERFQFKYNLNLLKWKISKICKHLYNEDVYVNYIKFNESYEKDVVINNVLKPNYNF